MILPLHWSVFKYKPIIMNYFKKLNICRNINLVYNIFHLLNKIIPFGFEPKFQGSKPCVIDQTTPWDCKKVPTGFEPMLPTSEDDVIDQTTLRDYLSKNDSTLLYFGHIYVKINNYISFSSVNMLIWLTVNHINRLTVYLVILFINSLSIFHIIETSNIFIY